MLDCAEPTNDAALTDENTQPEFTAVFRDLATLANKDAGDAQEQMQHVRQAPHRFRQKVDEQQCSTQADDTAALSKAANATVMDSAASATKASTAVIGGICSSNRKSPAAAPNGKTTVAAGSNASSSVPVVLGTGFSLASLAKDQVLLNREQTLTKVHGSRGREHHEATPAVAVEIAEQLRNGVFATLGCPAGTQRAHDHSKTCKEAGDWIGKSLAVCGQDKAQHAALMSSTAATERNGTQRQRQGEQHPHNHDVVAAVNCRPAQEKQQSSVTPTHLDDSQRQRQLSRPVSQEQSHLPIAESPRSKPLTRLQLQLHIRQKIEQNTAGMLGASSADAVSPEELGQVTPRSHHPLHSQQQCKANGATAAAAGTKAAIHSTQEILCSPNQPDCSSLLAPGRPHQQPTPQTAQGALSSATAATPGSMAVSHVPSCTGITASNGIPLQDQQQQACGRKRQLQQLFEPPHNAACAQKQKAGDSVLSKIVDTAALPTAFAHALPANLQETQTVSSSEPAACIPATSSHSGQSSSQVPVTCGNVDGWYCPTRDQVLLQNNSQQQMTSAAAVTGKDGGSSSSNASCSATEVWITKAAFVKLGGLLHNHDAWKAIKVLDTDYAKGVSLGCYLKHSKQLQAVQRPQREAGSATAAAMQDSTALKHAEIAASTGMKSTSEHLVPAVHERTSRSSARQSNHGVKPGVIPALKHVRCDAAANEVRQKKRVRFQLDQAAEPMADAATPSHLVGAGSSSTSAASFTTAATRPGGEAINLSAVFGAMWNATNGQAAADMSMSVALQSAGTPAVRSESHFALGMHLADMFHFVWLHAE
jgi:hypothetical protein